MGFHDICRKLKFVPEVCAWGVQCEKALIPWWFSAEGHCISCPGRQWRDGFHVEDDHHPHRVKQTTVVYCIACRGGKMNTYQMRITPRLTHTRDDAVRGLGGSGCENVVVVPSREGCFGQILQWKTVAFAAQILSLVPPSVRSALTTAAAKIKNLARILPIVYRTLCGRKRPSTCGLFSDT